jgi:hypothetical protein
MLTTTNLADLALVMKPQVKTRSTYRRLQRFFAGFAFDYVAFDYVAFDYVAFDYVAFDYVAFDYVRSSRFLLRLVPASPPHIVVCDRTEWHFGSYSVNVLMSGIAHKGVAFPISWTVLSHGGGPGAAEHLDLVDRFLEIVQPEQIRVLVADREFTGGDFLRGLKERSVPFVIRMKADRHVGPASKDYSLPAQMLMRPLSDGQSRCLNESCGEACVLSEAESVPVEVVGKQLSDGSMLILAACGLEEETIMEPIFEAYRKRWEIETLFAALKSRGFNLEATHLTGPERIRKLLGMLAFAYTWARLIGLERKRREGPLGVVRTDIRPRASSGTGWTDSASWSTTRGGCKPNWLSVLESSLNRLDFCRVVRA